MTAARGRLPVATGNPTPPGKPMPPGSPMPPGNPKPSGGRWLADADGLCPQGFWVADFCPVAEHPEFAGVDWAADSAVDDGPAPVVREVLKAGFWDRSCGDGGGFGAGGVGDMLPPGPVLAGLAGDLWASGLGRLSDDELIGILRAARRLASWAAAMELDAAADLWRRRTAEEDAGDTGAAEHAGDEIAAALTLTGRAAGTVLDLAIALHRLPATAAALTAGDIDYPRASVIAEELAGLGDADAAVVERAIIGAAAGQTTTQLRRSARRAVTAADADAARRRKEQALGEARVERWSETAGTAALAGRDLPPLSVLAADQNLTALAGQLKAAGCEGTMDTLRASAYLALLSGTPLTDLLPTGPAAPSHSHGPATGHPTDPATIPSPGPAAAGPAADPVAAEPDADGSPAAAAPGSHTGGSPAATEPDCHAARSPAAGLRSHAHGTPAVFGLADVRGGAFAGAKGAVNLTMPLATWLGLSQGPGHAVGAGPLDAADSRDLAAALATHAGTKWCLTFTDADGHPIIHGCARTGPPPGRRRAPSPTGPPEATGPPTTGPPPVTTSAGGRAFAAPPTAPPPGAPPPDAKGGTWTFTLTWLGGGDCDHARQTPAYQPTPTLRHLVKTRQPTCSFPGCARPGSYADLDHTVPYDQGGRTCLCNLGPLCRHHHQVKQAHGWTLEQTTPGTMTWTTPAGRRYTVQQSVSAS